MAPDLFLYSGKDTPNDTLARKNARQELQAAIQLSNILPKPFNVPAQVLINYKGFTIVRLIQVVV